MEKNIASHDLSDMMVYEGMYVQSRKLYFRQKFAHLKKIAEKAYMTAEHMVKSVKLIGRSQNKTLHSKQIGFTTSTSAALYSISIASVLISFFWLTLLLSVNP